jgi:hypothetical protein
MIIRTGQVLLHTLIQNHAILVCQGTSDIGKLLLTTIVNIIVKISTRRSSKLSFMSSEACTGDVTIAGKELRGDSVDCTLVKGVT